MLPNSTTFGSCAWIAPVLLHTHFLMTEVWYAVRIQPYVHPSSASGFGFCFQLLPCPCLRLALFLTSIQFGLLSNGMATFGLWPPSLHHLYSLVTCLYLPLFNKSQFLRSPNLTDDGQPLVSMLGHHHACLTCMKWLWVHGHGFQFEHVDCR